MTLDDTQWPRYQVFKQDRPDLPFENVGSVHAPDAEMALQNARDVFVRRPECSGLWVVPAEAILTTPDAPADAGEAGSQSSSVDAEAFQVFVKWQQTGTHVYRGTIEAHGPGEAMALARSSLDDPDHPGIVWWVCPARSVHQSDPDEADSLFAPAREKRYRQPAFYHTNTLMRAIRDERRQGEERSG